MNLHTYYQGPFLARVDKGRAIAYPVAGALVTTADYTTFTLMFSFMDRSLLEATVTAYVVGLITSYLLNRYWVFRKTASTQGEATSLWRYVVFLIVNLAITYGMLSALEAWFGMSPFIGKFVVGFFMFFWIFIGNNFFVFRGVKTGPIQI